MTKTTLKINGMACSMCEAHINEALRRAFPVKKVTSSHRKGTTEILSESPINQDVLKQVIDATGYQLLDLHSECYEKRGFFHK